MNTEQPSLTPEQATQIALERAIKDAFERTLGGTEEASGAVADEPKAGAPVDARPEPEAATHDELAPEPGWSGPEGHRSATSGTPATPLEGSGEPVEMVHAPPEVSPEVTPEVTPEATLEATLEREAVEITEAEVPTAHTPSVSEMSRKLVGDFGFRASQHGDAMAVAPRDEIEASRTHFSDARRALLDHVQKLESEVARLKAEASADSARGTLPAPTHSTTQRQH